MSLPQPIRSTPEQTIWDARIAAISEQALRDETDALEPLLKAVSPFEQNAHAISERAQELVLGMRRTGSGSGVEAFLYEYGLNNREGVAVMCLAEALLRIPDAKTADKLIQDKFSKAEWDSHLGHSESLFVNASTWGLMLTGKVVGMGTLEGEKPASVLGKLVNKCGEPVIRESLRRAMHIIGTQFVMGEEIDEALKNAKSAEKKGYTLSFDILGEGARNQEQADAYYESYLQALDVIGADAKPEASLFETRGMSVKLSGLHPKYYLVKEERLFAELLPRLKELVRRANAKNITLSIDAEEAFRHDINLKLFTALFLDAEFAGCNGPGYVLQAYQKRAFDVVEYLADVSRAAGRKMPIRLVKGAYWDSEIKHAQMQGLAGYPVFTRKEHTDLSYLACVRRIFDAYDAFIPQFATHNAHTVASVIHLAAGREFEFQRLHGMGEKLYSQLIDTIPCRIYAPVGHHEDLLAYLIRRLLENGANTSFVNLLMDKKKPLLEVVEDPIRKTREHHGKPSPKIPLPKQLYGRDRKNSHGVEPGYLPEKRALEAGLAKFAKTEWHAQPLVAGKLSGLKRRELPCPADLTRLAGTVEEGNAATVETAFKSAQDAWVEWNRTPVDARAALLERVGDLLEEHREEFYALCVREAGKNIPDAIAEVREAADFCRYYAARARDLMGTEKTLAGPTGESNRLQLAGRGVFACISPWNFPLAIFTGQVVAALVTGNCVIAKPADQTPLIAHRAVELMHEAGIPEAVLQLIPGSGADVGAAMVKHPQAAGVVFTGSTATARIINQALAKKKGPIVPLIAETGGQNCMIIDSSALLEQAVDDVITSAFGSTGQRCSALRVLYVQDDVADKFIRLLTGAMQEIKLGNPEDLSVDFGPVIDATARQNLQDHIDRMHKRAKFLAATPVPDGLNGHYVPPHAFEIPSITLLHKENFGPILHVVRYKAKKLAKMIEEINGTGYGLTFGIQSRIEQAVDEVIEHMHVGNIYVNRSMTGATVGVQPFGGEGLSGTGPKAGGPLYLTRFVSEHTVTINTAAIGGNLELLL